MGKSKNASASALEGAYASIRNIMLSEATECLERVKLRLRAGSSSQISICVVSDADNEAHRLTGAGGDARRGRIWEEAHCSRRPFELVLSSPVSETPPLYLPSPKKDPGENISDTALERLRTNVTQRKLEKRDMKRSRFRVDMPNLGPCSLEFL